MLRGSLSVDLCLLLVYWLLGPGIWAFWALGIYSSRHAMTLSGRYANRLREPLPLVSILVPAKDEGEPIRDCLQSLLNQDYPNFELIAIDDRSVDQTGRIMDEMAARDPRLRVLHIETLPAGWTGKTHALASGVKHARGAWLLFVDSDVTLSPAALSTTLPIAHFKWFDLLSLILRQSTRTFWEKMLIPMASAVFGATYLMGVGNSGGNRFSFGNGQFMLFKRAAYEQIGGHEAVKDHLNEDMELARLTKRAGLRPRIFWGAQLGAVRMYASFRTAMRGWSRIFYGSSNGSIWPNLAALAVVLLSGFSINIAAAWAVYRIVHPLAALVTIAWIAGVALHFSIMTVVLWVIYGWMGAPRAYAALFAGSAVLMVIILLRAIWMCLGGTVEWRATRYTASKAGDAEGLHMPEIHPRNAPADNPK